MDCVMRRNRDCGELDEVCGELAENRFRDLDLEIGWLILCYKILEK